MTQVSNQPQKMETGPMSGLPASLQYFAGLDEIIIKQKMEVLEALTGFETRNRYAVLNKDGQQIFFIQEESDTCERVCCPVGRGFTLHVTDNNVHEIMQFSREFKCCVGCCCFAGGCCQMVIAVDSPVGRRLGYIKTDTAPCKAHMKIYDANDQHMFTVWGSMCPCQCCGCTEDVNYPITDPSLKTRVGNIAKQWQGCCAEAFGDQFALSLPADMTLDCKALLLGAVFMVQFYVFEQQKQQH